MFSNYFEQQKKTSPTPHPRTHPALGWVVEEGMFSKSFENIPLFSNYFEKTRSEFVKIVNSQCFSTKNNI